MEPLFEPNEIEIRTSEWGDNYDIMIIHHVTGKFVKETINRTSTSYYETLEKLKKELKEKIDE